MFRDSSPLSTRSREIDEIVIKTLSAILDRPENDFPFVWNVNKRVIVKLLALHTTLKGDIPEEQRLNDTSRREVVFKHN
jgi:hypothetical protein